MYHQISLPRAITALISAALLAAQVVPAHACTYTCGVVSDKELYIYSGGAFGNKDYESYSYTGVTYGIMDIFELGTCWTTGDSGSIVESPVFDGKFNLSLDDETCTAFAVGFDNLSEDTDKNGPMIPYCVYTQDFGGIRGHVGYSFERDNESPFLVVDGDVGDACVGIDWAQINDGSDWESSIGVYTPLEFIDESCALYSYVTFSSDSEASETLTVEISYTIG